MKTVIIAACLAAAAGVVFSSPIRTPDETPTRPRVTYEQAHGQDLFDDRWRSYYEVKLGGTRGKVLIRPSETFIWDPEYPACQPTCTPHGDHVDVVVNPIPIHKYRPQEYYAARPTPGPLDKFPPYSDYGASTRDEYVYPGDQNSYPGGQDHHHDGHDGHHGGDGHGHHDKDGHHHHHRREVDAADVDGSIQPLEPRSPKDWQYGAFGPVSADPSGSKRGSYPPGSKHGSYHPGSESGNYPSGSKVNYPDDKTSRYPVRYGWNEHRDGEEEPFWGTNERLLDKYNYDARGCAVKGLLHDEPDKGCLIEDPDRGFFGTSRVKVQAQYPKVKSSFGNCCPCKHHKREEGAAEVDAEECCSCDHHGH